MADVNNNATIKTESESGAGAAEDQVYIPKLDVLVSHQDRFQVENFFKALVRGGSRLSRLWMFNRGNNAGNEAPQMDFNVDDMLVYSPDPIPTSLLKLSNDFASRAVKMFSCILKYMGKSGEYVSDQIRIELAQKLLHQGLKRPELKDELYMHLIKQTRGNPSIDGKMKAWELFHLVTSTMPPSKEFVGLVSEHIHLASHGDAEEPIVREIAMKAWGSLKRSAKAGSRKTLPSVEEIEALFSGKKLNCIVFFLDETFEELEYDITTTVLEGVEHLANFIKLQNYSTFTLFECRKNIGIKTPDDLGDEHLLLDDNRYIADIVFDFKNPKNARDGVQSKLLIKKKMFRETDEAITETQFINLSYIQAQYDYLLGNYPVVPEDASQLCALQIQAEHGTFILDNEGAVRSAAEKYIPKQSLETKPVDEWIQDVMCRYRSLEPFSKEDSRVQFLRILRSLPYGNSVFFPVRRIEDPIGLLPSKLILGINKRGVHFFRPDPKEYLHSAELRDIMQFGSSNQAVFFKMRVAGVLHIFQFETKQGEDICLALQTHINDIMMKRLEKSKRPSQQNSSSSAAAPAVVGGGGGGTTVGNAAFHGSTNAHSPGMPGNDRSRDHGPKYEKQVGQMQKMLEEKAAMIEELQKREEDLKTQKSKIAEEINEEMDKLRLEERERTKALEQKKKLEIEREDLEKQIDKAKKALGEAEATKAAAVDAAKEAVDAQKLKELESQIQSKTDELQVVQEKYQALDKEYKKIEKEKDLKVKKIQRLEVSRENETKELREKLDAAKATVGSQLGEKDTKIKELMEELDKTQKLYNKNKLELEQIKMDLSELDDLREMKADVERKEKQQKVIIENQAKRLDELENLHKEEQMLRKKYMSMLEDMQGKVRVNVRLGRLPEGEDDALELQDEYTLAKKQADKYAVREEFAFDQAFGSNSTNDEVKDSVKVVTNRSFEGYNVCIVSYGLSGSGKTHTLYGNDSEDGVIYKSYVELIELISRKKKWTGSAKTWMMDVNGDVLTDLLKTDGKNKNLVVKKDIKGLVHTVNLTQLDIPSEVRFKEILKTGLKAQKGLSSNASDGHLITGIEVECTNNESGLVTIGRIIFFDLAGANRGNADIDNIHSVIAALEEEAPEIPYTSCTITKLLSDCLGGNAKTMIITHVCPHASLWAESKDVLEIGLRIRKIKNETQKNELNKDLLKLKKQVDSLKSQAGVPKHLIDAVDMVDISDVKEVPTEA